MHYMFLTLFPEQSAKMRLSTIFELLLILLLVAFAAYGRVIGEKNKLKRKCTIENKNKYKIWKNGK